MKIALSVDRKDPDAMMDSRFGRAKCFMIYDTENGQTDFVDNTQNLNAAQGAGIQSAQNVAACEVEALICGHTGPKAFSVLSSAGISVYNCDAAIPAKEAIESFKKGSLKKAEGADVDSHWV